MERTVIYNSGTVFGLHESISIAYVWNGFERGLEAHFSTLLPLHHKDEASMFPICTWYKSLDFTYVHCVDLVGKIFVKLQPCSTRY